MSVGLERLSRGTMEQIYFALRMAAGELFCEEESFPVILDDVFGMYDEDSLAAVLRWMHKEQKQIIISTCIKEKWRFWTERESLIRNYFLNFNQTAKQLFSVGPHRRVDCIIYNKKRDFMYCRNFG